METQIKKTVRAGNSSAVILPKAWLNQEVRVELVRKTPEKILNEVLDIIKKHIRLKDIIGVYLVGSYARNEQTPRSDIDIVVTTNNIDKEMISEKNYRILLVSSELLNQKLKSDLLPVGPMLREAKPLLNSAYLDKIEIKITKNNINNYIITTEEKLRIIKKIFDKLKNKTKGKIPDRVTYTLVLRIRTLYIIKKLILNEDYSNKEFIKIIKKISVGTRAYDSYLRVKSDSKRKKQASFEEIRRLYEYLKEQLAEVKMLVH